MYAVIMTGGKQYKVSEGDVIKVEKLGKTKGENLEFKDIILLDKDGELVTDKAKLSSARVEGKVVEEGESKKVIIFKKKKKKNYMRTRGHRQEYSGVLITKISI